VERTQPGRVSGPSVGWALPTFSLARRLASTGGSRSVADWRSIAPIAFRTAVRNNACPARQGNWWAMPTLRNCRINRVGQADRRRCRCRVGIAHLFFGTPARVHWGQSFRRGLTVDRGNCLPDGRQKQRMSRPPRELVGIAHLLLETRAGVRIGGHLFANGPRVDRSVFTAPSNRRRCPACQRNWWAMPTLRTVAFFNRGSNAAIFRECDCPG